MDITDFYYGNYGAFKKEIVTLKRLCQIGSENPTFVENENFVEKSQNQDLLDITEYNRYYVIFQNRIIWKIMVRNVSPLCLIHSQNAECTVYLMFTVSFKN